MQPPLTCLAQNEVLIMLLNALHALLLQITGIKLYRNIWRNCKKCIHHLLFWLNFVASKIERVTKQNRKPELIHQKISCYSYAKHFGTPGSPFSTRELEMLNRKIPSAAMMPPTSPKLIHLPNLYWDSISALPMQIIFPVSIIYFSKLGSTSAFTELLMP